MKKIYTGILLLTITLLFRSSVFGATLRTDTNPPATTKVGNPTTSSSSLVAAATELGTVIGAACGGSLHKSNIDCIPQGISFQNVPNPAAAIALIAQSATNNLCDDAHPEKGYCLQCVGFVQGAVAGTYGQPLNNGGNASDFATSVPTGYQYIPLSSGTPQEGDIIIKTGGYGHIAIVTKIYGSGRIQVAEANWNVGGEIGPPQNVALSLWAGWLRKQ